MKHIQHKQSGFTLVEIAIVLVIIGLLLGGVLKGQEMINNAKIKSVINDMKSVPTAYYAYMDRYRAIPGDDSQASTRFATLATNGNGDGAIGGTYTTQNWTIESTYFWRHTGLAGFTTGPTDQQSTVLPNNSVGGLLGVQSQVGAAGNATYGMTGPVVCAGNVPWKIAQSVDTQLDDGNAAGGNLRAGLGTAGSNAATVAAAQASVYGPGTIPTTATEAGLHTICMQI